MLADVHPHFSSNHERLIQSLARLIERVRYLLQKNITSMKLIHFLTIAFCLGFSTLATSQNLEYTDASGKKQLIGQCSRQAFQKEAYQEWFNANYNEYAVNLDLLKKAKRKKGGVTFEIFLGTWCGDSKREVPRFLKVLDALKVEESAISIINLNNADTAYKQSPTHEEEGKLIHRVPTFIMYKKGIEIGRIVESPVTSLEMDLVQILLDLPTASNYKGVHQMAQLLAEKGVTTDKKELFQYAVSIQRAVHSSSELNSYGYFLLRKEEIDKAIVVFYVNAVLFRNETNSFDSLAEGYEKKGDKESALSMYKKTLELDPNNEHAKERIADLEG